MTTEEKDARTRFLKREILSLALQFPSEIDDPVTGLPKKLSPREALWYLFTHAAGDLLKSEIVPPEFLTDSIVQLWKELHIV
jgi:hypothetical protein